MGNRFSTFTSKVKKSWANSRKKTSNFLRHYPIWSLAAAFALFVILVVASFMLQPAVEPPAAAEKKPLNVKAVQFGSNDISEDTIGTVENKSTITLVAQSAGPISKIEKNEGESVMRGTVIARQESAYAAGNAASIQRKIAQQNYVLADESLKNTVEIVVKTRQQADLAHSNADELRKISQKSISDTEGYIKNLETQYDQLKSLLDGAAGFPDLEVQYRGSLISTQGFLNQSRVSLDQLRYSVDTNNAPSKLQDIQRDSIYTSTELQLKAAEIQKKIAGLTVQSAKIAEAATRVTAPINGTVQKMLVSEGEYVTPGTPVAIITGQAQLQLKVSVSGTVASRVDTDRNVYIKIGDQSLSLPILHVSTVPVAGQLYELVATIPEGYANQIFEGQSVEVTLPLYSVSIVGGNYYVPLDSVFITNTDTFVFVDDNGQAKKKSVIVGSIVGSNIEIVTGLVPGDVVILDRRVLDQQLIDVELVTSPTTITQELG